MKLSPEQLLAVQTTHSRVMVVAGAGSGKTRVITERLKHLVETGTPAEGIVCITFTRNSAEEMRQRLHGVKGIDKVFIGTIHAFATKLMGYTGERFQFMGAVEEETFLKELLKPYSNSKNSVLERYTKYTKYLTDLNNGVPNHTYTELDDILEDEDKLLISSLLGKSNAYGYIKTVPDLARERGYITFDDLIVKASAFYSLLKTGLTDVLVDEFQDVGTLEYRFISALSAQNYFFVGDDWQSIYSFKGGNVEIFKKLITSGEFKPYYLSTNYRCGDKIGIYAGEIIRQLIKHGQALKKKCNYFNINSGVVEMLDNHRNQQLIETIRSLKVEELGNCFILVRKNKELDAVLRLFEANSIPVTTFKQGNYTTAELKTLLEKPQPKVLTIHSAKGLEADVVILLGTFNQKLEEWKISSYHKSLDSGVTPFLNIYEEQRLFYVACTRAIKKLIIMPFHIKQ